MPFIPNREAEKGGLLSVETSLVSIVRSRSARTTQDERQEKPFLSRQIGIAV